MSRFGSRLESRVFPALMGLGAVLLVGLLGLLLDFNGLYGQDSYAYVGYAAGLRAWLAGGEMPEAIFWPEAYPMAGALLSWLTGDVARACLWVSAFSVGFAVYWLVRLARLRSWGNGAVWAVALTLGASPFLLRNGMMCMSDAMAVALVAGTLRHVVGYRDGVGKWGLVWAVGLAALAVATRYAAAALVGPLVLVGVWRSLSRRDWGGLALATVLLGGIAALHVHLQGFASGEHHFLSEWSPLHFFQREFDMVDGHFAFSLPNLAFVFGIFYHPGFLGLGLLLVPIAFFRLLFGHRPHLIFLLPLLLYLLFLAGIPFQNQRFLLLALPLALPLLFPAADRLHHWLSHQPFLWPAALIFLLAFNSFLALRSTKTFAENSHLQAEIAAHVEKYEGHAVYTFGLEAALKQLSPEVEVRSLWEPQIPPAHPGDIVVFNMDAFAEQWAGKSPMQNWDFLQSKYNLAAVSNFREGWVLYEIR